jgi:hypothetical protein
MAGPYTGIPDGIRTPMNEVETYNQGLGNVGRTWRRIEMRTRFTATGVAGAIALAACLGVTRTASAHHGQAGMYELGEMTKLEGVIKDVRWGNPHVIVTFDVKGASGVEQWSIELSSITTMEEGGAKREMLAVGDRIIVNGHRHRTDRLLILPRSIVKPDGTTAVPVPVRRSIFGAPTP